MKTIEKAAVIGRGAIGILYGNELERAGLEPVFLADDVRRQRYESQPLLVNGVEKKFVYGADPYPMDLILITTKAGGLADALETIRPWVGKDTVILPCQNGIISEEMVRKAYPDQVVLRTIVQGMDSLYLDGVCTYSRTGQLLIGADDVSQEEAVLAVKAYFDRSSLFCRVCDDIVREQWNKLMLNCGVNQICAVYGTGYGGILQEPLRSLFVKTMEEVRQVAGAEGIVLTQEDIDEWLETVADLDADSMPSMAQDVKAGRKTEAELFSPTVMRLAEKHHIATPCLKDLKEKIDRYEKSLS